jgi:steroid 5-alpha reductase family enzyme
MPAQVLEFALLSCAMILACWVLLWAVSLVLEDASIGDTLYPLPFLIVATVFFFRGAGNADRERLVLALVTLWALRLSVQVGWRNWNREDPRYARQRAYAASIGRSYAWYSLTHVFLSLGALSGFAVAAPLFLAQRTPDPALGVLAGAGTALFALGLVFETVADLQLAAFRRDPRNANQVLQHGLWRYSRHPNYFGEVLVWTGLFLIAAETPWGWLAIVSPLTTLWLLAGPTGLLLIERRMRKKRPEAFAEYARRTSAFVPWFPQR